MITKKSTAPVTSAIATAVANLDKLLTEHYGCDYAYTVMGRGMIVAASNAAHGRIEPRTE